MKFPKTHSSVGPVGADKFVAALNTIVTTLKATTGQATELTGDTRVVVPLALLLSRDCSTEEVVSILLRMRALQLLLKTGILDDWTVADAGDDLALSLHATVAEVAATLPVTEGDDRFSPRLFLARLREIAAERVAAAGEKMVRAPSL